MAEAALKEKLGAAEQERELTDGFNLIIDALKLNGLTTIYGVPGIPITDFGRMAQAAGIRVLSFRHEQNAAGGSSGLHRPKATYPRRAAGVAHAGARVRSKASRGLMPFRVGSVRGEVGAAPLPAPFLN